MILWLPEPQDMFGDAWGQEAALNRSPMHSYWNLRRIASPLLHFGHIGRSSMGPYRYLPGRVEGCSSTLITPPLSMPTLEYPMCRR